MRDDTIQFLATQGWRVINWSIDTFDWDVTQSSAKEIMDMINKYHHPGAIVLMHSGKERDETIVALPGIIRDLRAEGYKFMTVTELLSGLELKGHE